MTKVEQFLKSKGFDLDRLLNDPTEYKVTNLDKAAQCIKAAVNANRHIHVVADYDCDGVMAGSILYLILRKMGADFGIRFPKKMSEGYGISDKIVDEIPNGSLVITIDNGISAVESIDLANSRGMDVVILDHHQMRGDGLIPNATIVVDPHVFKREDEFEHYCGAGLGHKLAIELGLPEDVVNQTKVLAAIATIGDVVPLVDDNRNIVKHGLELLNKEGVKLPGLYSLCDALNLTPTTGSGAINEEDIAFQIGPCVNAMGRMLDDGAADAFKYLMGYSKFGQDGIRSLVEWNKKRKEETVKQQNILDMVAANVKKPKTTCMVLYAPQLHEGIIGINAAKVVEKYNMPAIILTDSEEDGILKGSARSIDGVDMKEALDKVADLIFKYGGHAGAAGLSVEKDKFVDFAKAINAVIPKVPVNKNTWVYDLEIGENEVRENYEALKKYAPYGEEFPAPVFRINNFYLIKSYGKYYRYIGDNGVSLNGANSEAVSFSLKEKFKSLGTPLSLNIVGTIGYSRYSKRPQVMINDIQPIIKQQANTGYLL